MRFIHIADVHLGARPDAGRAYSTDRGAELWEALERVVAACRREQIDLLLIAGDLFHRQPLLGELKEVDSLFASMEHTKVVLMAGNHDYLKPSSFYRTYQWKSETYMFTEGSPACFEFPELGACVYGLSYTEREIREPLYNRMRPQGRQPVEILLAHGGDTKHSPIDKTQIKNLGYDYVAFGHIHKPMMLEKDRIYYAGSLEPVDPGDLGEHGYIRGEITRREDGRKETQADFVPDAKREYIPIKIEVDQTAAGRDVRERLAGMIQRRGVQHMYHVKLCGFRDPDITFDLSGMDVYGNVIQMTDETHPAWDFAKLLRQNEGNLLGRYIAAFIDSGEGSVESQALYDGVQALITHTEERGEAWR